jgi:hypothetical protein
VKSLGSHSRLEPPPPCCKSRICDWATGVAVIASVVVRDTWRGRRLLLVSLLVLLLTNQTGFGQQIANISAPPGRVPSLSSEANASPIDFFRQLLTMDENEREHALANRNASQRKLILAKVNEYEALTPEERELRLRLLELRYYLQPLMQMDRTNRAVKLATVPQAIRRLVEDRLTQWDLLPPDLKQEVLEAATTRNYFIRLESSTPAQRQAIFKTLPPQRRNELEEGFAQWHNLTMEQKIQHYKRLNRFFELTEDEQQKTIKSLSEPERQQIQKVLAQFDKLSVENRRYCLQSFYRFASLSPVDKDLFLKNAERWQALSPSERQAWRDLVTKLPPLPPGVEPFAPPPMPP